MGFKSHWLLWPTHQLKDVLFLFPFNVSLAELTGMVWVIILHEYKSFTHKSHSTWNRVMLQCAMIADLIHFSFTWRKSPTLQLTNLTRYHYKASSMLEGWCDTRGCSSFTKSSLLIDPPIWFQFNSDFKLWFLSSKDFILLLYCSVFPRLGLLILFSFLTNSFLTAILPYRPTSQSLLLTADVNINSNMQWWLEQSAFYHTSRWL